MSLLVVVPLVLSAALCFVPAYLLRRQAYVRAQDYLVASQSTPLPVIRNSAIACSVRVAAFGPLFAWGASGDLWPAIVAAVFFGFGWSLLYVLRRPVLAFLDGALGNDRSITVHDFIARQHGNDPRVRLLASGLTLLAILGLIVIEAVAVATLLKLLLMGNTTLANLAVLGMLALAALGAMFSGNSGVMHSTQLQLGMVFLGLFGSTALLLYLHVSALTSLPPHGTFAIALVAAWCALIPWYRRSRYADTTLVGIADQANGPEVARPSLGAKILKKFAQILNPSISVFAVLVVVIAAMEFYFAGLSSVGRDWIAALQSGTRASTLELVALALLPLFYPIVDVANWQRMAAIEKDVGPGNVEPGRQTSALRSIFRISAVEVPLLWLSICMFGAIAVVAMETPAGPDVTLAFMTQLVVEQNEVTVVVLPLLLVGVFAIALSTMMSLFSAGLCTIRYDVLSWFGPEPSPGEAQAADEPLPRRHAMIAGLGFFLSIAASFFIAVASLQISFGSSTFLAVLFLFCCAQLAFLPLVLGPLLRRTNAGFGTVSPRWAFAIPCAGTAGAVCAVTVAVVTGNGAWLWAAVPACLGSGLFLFAIARLSGGPIAGDDKYRS